MTIRKLVGEVLEQLGPSHWRQEMGDYAEDKRVTANTGEVFSEQVGCSFGIAGGSCAHYFDVVAFPVHLLAGGTLRHGPGKRFEIGQSDSEAWVGADREAQCDGGPVGIDGALRVPVPCRRQLVGAEGAPVVLNYGPRHGPLIIVRRLLAPRWLHAARLPGPPEVPLRRC